MKESIFPLLLLVALALVGCRNEDDPLSVRHTPGKVIVGLPGEGMLLQQFDPPIGLSPVSSYFASYSLMINAETNVAIDFGSFILDYQSPSTNMMMREHTVRPQDARVEFAVYGTVDTTWTCHIPTPADVDEATQSYTGVPPQTCTGPSTLESVAEHKAPLPMEPFQLIDDHLQWSKDLSLTLRLNLETENTHQDGGRMLYRLSSTKMLPWSSGNHFLAFRYQANTTTWKYGYVNLAVTDTQLQILGWAVEA